MRSGLALSIISSFLVFISCYVFFNLKFGKIAGLGAILALATSVTFISYSMQATSDLFFMALLFGALAFIALAEVKNRLFCWFLAGIFTGMAVITRTNGFALMGLLLFAITYEGRRVSRIKAAMLFTLGMLIPIVGWISFALYSGSPILPTSGHKILALTYFSKSSDRYSGDAWGRASVGLTNTWQVLTKDPVHIAKTYIHDLVSNIKSVLSEEDLLPFPLIHLALPAPFVLLFMGFNRFKLVLVLNLLGMFLLLNFHAWADRYFLFIVPFIGAGIASILAIVYSDAKKNSHDTVIFLLASFLSFSSVFSIRQIKHALDYRFSNLSFDSIEASNVIKKSNISKNAIVIARKPHLGFYTKLHWETFPDVESL